VCGPERRSCPERQARTVAQHKAIELRANFSRRCQIAGQDRPEAPAGWDSANFRDMPFHDASGGKDLPIENVNGLYQTSLDRLPSTLDCDATFQRYAQRDTRFDCRPRLTAGRQGSLLGHCDHGNRHQTVISTHP
jgi:hypothetical protein